jgi:hypothetical protein
MHVPLNSPTDVSTVRETLLESFSCTHASSIPEIKIRLRNIIEEFWSRSNIMAALPLT